MLKKNITFIYSDSAERNNYQPIADEAIRRGYKVSFTDNKFQRCDIGFYCQHVNFPQFSRFSVIMLHDIIQGYSRWPDLWYEEPWNKYDIGILPSQQWIDNWNQCSQWFYARPRIGMFKIGWPKADIIINLKERSSRRAFYQKYHLDINKRTVLYAPAWENDNKQDEFVQSMLKLDVNILIKQAKWNDNYPHIIQNIKEMYRLHKDNPRITILPPETNIFEAIAVSDILVSEESSTMCEAAMMGIPAVSVTNWLIPDVIPSRYPKCDYSFVITTVKENLTECIMNILTNYQKFKQESIEFDRNTFSNIGNTSSLIMDIIDDVVEEKKIRYGQIEPNENRRISFAKDIKRRFFLLKREIGENYSERYILVRFIWKGIKYAKNKFFKIKLLSCFTNLSHVK